MQATPTRALFEWNGHNYLIKMLHDCDFLDLVEPLRRWLGFGTSCNPFFVPLSSQSDPSDGSTDLEGRQPLRLRLDKNGLTDVGRQSSVGPFEVPSAMDNFADGGKKAWTRNGIKRKAQIIDGASPYVAAVVNDPRILPPTKGFPPSRGGGPPSAKSAALKAGVSGGLPTRATVNVEGLVPNIVSREDMERVRVARQVLIEEEMRVVAATDVAVATEERESRSTTIYSEVPKPRKDSRNTPFFTLDSRQKARRSSAGLTLGSLHKMPRKVPLDAASGLKDASSTPTPSNGEIHSLSLNAAGLMQQPPPQPHPGLGPVLLRSDLPGGEFHPNPFLHTVTSSSADGRAPYAVGVATSASDGLLRTEAERDRCSTAPAVPPVSDDFVEPQETCDFSGRVPTDRDGRAATAPSTMSVKSVSRPQTFTTGEESHFSQSRQRSSSKGTARLSAIRSRQILSRKAGAELRALTAAGTTGRRQPPPREARLRRLARDVQRHSAELKKLAGDEEQLEKSLACVNGRTREPLRKQSKLGEQQHQQMEGIAFRSVNTTGSPVGTVEAVLEAKRREIALKSFHLGVKRDELRCLLMVQKHERHRKRDLELERLRTRLEEGQVRPALGVIQLTAPVLPWLYFDYAFWRR